MARVGRLAGAILADSRGDYYLVGQTKVPCDWAKAGFQPPGEIEAPRRPFVRLVRLASAGEVHLGSPYLTLSLEGDDLAAVLAARLIVERNGSVSERLWRLVVYGEVDGDGGPPEPVIDARWLGEIPQAVWQVVRDTVLRCS
jgi:hypothetical protein